MLLGAHISTAGGVDKSFARAAALGCTSFQIFTKSNRQWNAKPLEPETIDAYHQQQAETGIEPVICHASYLLNLGAPDETVWNKSLDALEIELQRCEQLKIPYLVLHPGGHMKMGLDAGLTRATEALDIVHERVPDVVVKIALEITAGQGTHFGRTFEEIAHLIAGAKESERLVVCFDTCHALAAGYEFRDPDSYEAMITEFDQVIGLDRLKAFHLNDSEKDLASHVDRHAHIGEGRIGLEPFGYFLNDPRFQNIPFLIETPVKQDPEDNIRNLAALRGLIR